MERSSVNASFNGKNVDRYLLPFQAKMVTYFFALKKKNTIALDIASAESSKGIQIKVKLIDTQADFAHYFVATAQEI